MTLRARDRLQRQEGKPPAAALRAAGDRESQAGYRRLGAIWDAPPQRWSSLDGSGCFYLCLSPFPKQAAYNPVPSLRSTSLGLGLCSPTSTCMGRGEHPTSILSDPVLAQGSSRRRGQALPVLPRGKGSQPPLCHTGGTASTQAGSPDHSVHILRAQNKYLKVEKKTPLLLSASKFSVFALGFEAETDRNMTKEMQVSANHGHIRSDGFQVPALLQDKFPPGHTPDNLNSPRGLQVCSPCRHAVLRRAHLLTPIHPAGDGSQGLTQKSLSKPVKTGPGLWGLVSPPRHALRACPRGWALRQGVRQTLPNPHPRSRALPEEQTTARLSRCLT